jgi:hypothetical protein
VVNKKEPNVEQDLENLNENLENVTQSDINRINDNISRRAASDTYIDQWKNRRSMAWLSLISIIIVTLLALFYVTETRLDTASDVLTWFYITLSSIVGAYMGLSTWASFKGK